MNTGYTQVKHSMVNQWPIVSGDLGDIQDLLKIAGEIKVIKPGSSSKLQSQGGPFAASNKNAPHQQNQSLIDQGGANLAAR